MTLDLNHVTDCRARTSNQALYLLKRLVAAYTPVFNMGISGLVFANFHVSQLPGAVVIILFIMIISLLWRQGKRFTHMQYCPKIHEPMPFEFLKKTCATAETED